MSIQSLGSAGQSAHLDGVSRAIGSDSNQAASIRRVDPTSSSGVRGLGEIAQYVQSVQSQPAARADRVNALKAQIANGTYKVPIDQLAARLAGIGDA